MMMAMAMAIVMATCPGETKIKCNGVWPEIFPKNADPLVFVLVYCWW